MARLLLTALFILLFFLNTIGQSDNRPKAGPGFYLNSFQSFSEKNVDSSLHYVRLLAENKKYSGHLQELLHNSFAQTFQKMWEREAKDSLSKSELKKRVNISYKILEGMMSDSIKSLVNAAKPIYFWTRVLQNEDNNRELMKLTNEFIATELVNDIYDNRVGRYALLIYQVISKNEPLKKLSDQLLKRVNSKLKNSQINVNIDTASRFVLEKRTWHRYLYAYSNTILAYEALEKNNTKDAGKHFKIAFDYSPDLTDNNNSSGYFYDMYFLLEKEKRGFQDDYLNYLTNYSLDKQQTLSALLTMALTDPAYKEQLKSFYNTHFTQREDFNEYWVNNINKEGKNAPGISLKKTDGLLFSSAANKGKWILIDFWGTWCTPCRKEHPDLDSFYQTIKSSHSDKIILLTVACKDKEDKVAGYMTEFNYSFPVAMADNEIEKNYNIKGYPSKILISPQGKYLIVPFGIDWVDFVSRYADL